VLFIVDPWLWLILGGGLAWAWVRRKGEKGQGSAPVSWALGLALAYIGAMAISSLVARRLVAREIQAGYDGAVLTTMAGPLPLTPVTRSFVVEQEKHYRVGAFHWLPRPHITQVASYPRRSLAEHPAYGSADSILVFRRFMGWARFPTLSLEQIGPGQYLVHVVDLRYARTVGTGFGALTVPVRLSTMEAGND
jgi:inner membrane protein